MDFEAWLQFGIDNGWAGPPVCETHDGLPMTEDESTAFEAGEDPCVHILRLYDDVPRIHVHDPMRRYVAPFEIIVPVVEPLTRDVDVHPATSGTLRNLRNLTSLVVDDVGHREIE